MALTAKGLAASAGPNEATGAVTAPSCGKQLRVEGEVSLTLEISTSTAKVELLSPQSFLVGHVACWRGRSGSLPVHSAGNRL